MDWILNSNKRNKAGHMQRANMACLAPANRLPPRTRLPAVLPLGPPHSSPRDNTRKRMRGGILYLKFKRK